MSECNTACDALLLDKNWKEQLFPNVREAINVMNLRGLTVGVFTGTRHDAMQNQIAYHDLGHLIDARYMRGKDNDRDGAVKSAVLKRAQIDDIVTRFRTNQMNPNAGVIIVGDTRSDVEAARDLGLIFVGFAADDKKRQELEDAGAKYIVTDYGDLPDMVHRLIQPAANDAAARPTPKQSFHPK
jgi:phosphoglycolate phosphatase-like HAD superfamily hydrolase